jgi:hypothetical protein
MEAQSRPWNTKTDRTAIPYLERYQPRMLDTGKISCSGYRKHHAKTASSAIRGGVQELRYTRASSDARMQPMREVPVAGPAALNNKKIL